MINQHTEELIKAACLGDKQALSHLLIVCQPDVRRLAKQTCSTTEDAEDAVQITLWQLYRKIGTLKTIATFASWLFRIIERECYRLFRARQSASINNEFNLDSITAPHTDKDLHIDLTNLIIALPQLYREVLIMRDIEEYTTPETAEKLGISVEAVKSRLHRARAMIKAELDMRGYLKGN